MDFGTQSVRAVALDDRGTPLAAAAQPLTSRREGDRHEQDPNEWVAAGIHVLRQVTRALEPSVRIRALAVSGTSGTVVPVDAVTGEPRGAAAMYDDRRGAAYLPRVAEAGAEVWSRLGYRMQESWALPKMLQMRDEGALDGGGIVFASQPDVMVGVLAGRLLRSDLSSALKSGADLDSASWPENVLDRLGLPLGALNELAASGECVGEVDADAADRTGLPVGCAIVAGMTDGCAAQIAAGALTPGSWNSVLGTTLVIKGSASLRLSDPSGAVYAHRAPFDAGWYPGGASSTGAGAVTRMLPGRDLNALTADLAPDIDPPLAYPLVGRGERFPFLAANAVGIMPAPSSDLETFSAILHGVAYIERLAFDLLASTGYGLDGALLLTGGGSRNPWWTQLRADMLGRVVQLPVHSEGAAGMAILAAAGHSAAEVFRADGRDPLAAASARLTPPATSVTPDPRRTARLMPAYQRMVDLFEAEGWLPAALARAARERLPE